MLDCTVFSQIPNFFRRHGFTLMEIMVAIVLVAVAGSLALNKYNMVLEQSYCRDAQFNLVAMANGAKVLYAQTQSTTLPGGVTTSTDVNLINTGLRTRLTNEFFVYQYWGGSVDYTCRATRIGLGYDCYIIGGEANPINPPNCGGNTNPYCSPIM